MQNRIKWIVIFFLFLFAATFIFYGVKMYMLRWYTAHYQEPPVYVSVTKAAIQTWQPTLSTVGSLKASNGVEVNSEVSGQILSIDFQSGGSVHQGDLLVQLNDDIDQQSLLRDEAQLRFNKIDYERKEKLLRENAVAKNSVDAARAAYLQSQAAVQSDQVMIAKKKIRAPFSGKIGIRQVNIGQYITPGTAIVSLQNLQPMFVDFSLSEQELPKLKTGQTVELHVDAYPDQLFYGKITALNSAVDVNTRSISVRATTPNQKELLYPGLFARVDVLLPVEKNVLTVPQTAITYSLYGDSIYIIENKGKDKQGQPNLIAVQKYVTVGERRGDVAQIVSGIQAGDDIVTSGQIKLHPNANVLINNAVKLQ